MTEAAKSFPVIREAVASFPDREHFRSAVSALLRGVRARRPLGPGVARFARRRGGRNRERNGPLVCRAQRRDQIRRALDHRRYHRAVGRTDRSYRRSTGRSCSTITPPRTTARSSRPHSRPARRCCGCAARTPTASSRQPGSSKEPAEPICMSMAARLGPTDPVARRSRGRR